ncbi:hypothetical protein [Streptomyces sp. NPDC097619]|uniref:hypothetical protein n=1 Tax=Streptomyces sp. NPDC097619 TaxID=3157228 RepID=UPI00331A537A
MPKKRTTNQQRARRQRNAGAKYIRALREEASRTSTGLPQSFGDATGEHGLTIAFPYGFDGYARLGCVDVRAYGPGIQMSVLPAESIDAATGAAPWVTSYSVGTNGVQGPADRLAGLLATSTSGDIARTGEGHTIVYAADPVTGLGALAEVDSALLLLPEGTPAPPTEGILRRMRLPLEVWEELGRAMSATVIPRAEAGSAQPGTVMGHHPCDACERPVFDSCPSTVLMGRDGLMVVCPSCVDGSSLALCRGMSADRTLPPVEPTLLARIEGARAAALA